jgi:hypothetical protein
MVDVLMIEISNGNIQAAFRLLIVSPWRGSPEGLLSSNTSEPTEFRFGSIE